MRFFMRSIRLLALACVVLGLAACERGPMEKGGKAVDDKVKDITK